MRLTIDISEHQLAELDSLSKSLDICRDTLVREAVRAFVQRNRQAMGDQHLPARAGSAGGIARMAQPFEGNG